MKEIINETFANERIDIFLSKMIPDLSRSKAQKMLEKELVKVNGKVVKANARLKINDKVTYSELEVQPIDLKPEDLKIEIVYQDDDVAVVYKPKGMVVHPGAGNHDETLVNGLLYAIKDLSGINGSLRPGIVHRIDKDTTGLLLIAKNDFAHKALAKDLANKKVRRVYYAIVTGNIIEDDGVINAPIGRDPRNRLKMAVQEGGKEAITTFHVLERFGTKTFIECVLKTGRTHQIRVHMAYIHHPVYGDPLYARKTPGTSNGQYLHAGIIGYNDPKTGVYREFSYPLPKYFSDELDNLRRKNDL